MKHAIRNDKDFSRATAHAGIEEKSDLTVKLLKIVFRVSVGLTFAVIFLVGIWAVLAMISAATGSGGVMALIEGWFGAVGG